ncbi:MAG: hypothetical protein ACLU5F_05655 [Anaerovoracaceae bacterium]
MKIPVEYFGKCLSWIVCRKNNLINKQEKQEQVYQEIKRLIDSYCDYFTLDRMILYDSTAVQNMNQNEEEQIVRAVFRYFGSKAGKELKQILDWCKQAQQNDYEMRILLNLLKEAEPAKYDRLRDVLVSECSEHTNDDNQRFLSTIQVLGYRICDEDRGKDYNYCELKGKTDSLYMKANKAWEELDTKLKKMMTKR